jgi:hypothetical protein
LVATAAKSVSTPESEQLIDSILVKHLVQLIQFFKFA